MKIDSIDALNAALANASGADFDAIMAEAVSRYGQPDANNFYLIRDFLRLNWHGAGGVLRDEDEKWTPVDGGNKDHFLHVSKDDPTKVVYNKNADKARQDIHTRTTPAKYFANFENAGANADVFVPAPAPTADMDLGALQARVGSLQGRTTNSEAILSVLSDVVQVLTILADKAV